MIAWLRGEVAEQTIDGIVLDVGGVGYGLLIPVHDLARLSKGKTVVLQIHEHIREDAHDLYGFVDKPSKELFEQLLSVKNVGPKVALAILGIGQVEAVKSAIAGGDVKLLQTAKGVGKRAAEQVVVELRDKVGLIAGREAENIVSRGSAQLYDEAVQALIALGYTDTDAATSLQGVDQNLTTEERVKLALKGNR